MRMLFYILSFFAFTNIFSQTNDTDLYRGELILTGEWKLRKIGDEKWIDSVNFPNSIHRILWEKKIIENPYYGDNEKKLNWIEESDWEAEMEFGGITYELPYHEIHFESLEPYVRVYLNGHFLFESDNAFREYKFDIGPFINKNSNSNKLRLEMDSPIKRGKQLQAKNKIILPGDERVYTRKPQYEYGWDWGPRFVKTGVKSWISIFSHLDEYTEIIGYHITTKSSDEKKAELIFEFDIFSDVEQERFVKISQESNNYYNKKHILKKGKTHFSIPISINNPKIWWPNGMGKQSLNYLDIEVKDKDDFRTSLANITYAICDIKLIQQKDSLGESFYFSVNGQPTYLKGFNLIPESHISEFDNINDNYSNLITRLREMNCNAVRIWGGGEYLPDQVMDELQSYGIIVWQDFMFAGGMYPGDSSFLKNVEEEITYQVKRLRNYNNIALYCGNNEIDEAWHNWGWQKQYNYSKEDSIKIGNDYLKLFHELIPSIIKKYDADVDYIPSSPEIGWGRKESMTQGDSHYWGVWWGKEPIETFEEKIPRFMSEFGMQAMPDLSTLRKVIPDSLMNFDSPEFKNHQKHPTGFETINYYLEKYLTVPDQLEEYSYATQLLQTITLQTAISAQRISPKCRGTLIWQLSDTWPVTSWSVIDSEGKLKLAARYLEQDFSNVQIFQKRTSDKMEYYVVNDDLEANEVEASIALFSFDGINISNTSFNWILKPGIHKIYEMEYSEENNFVITSITGTKTHNFKTFLTKNIRNYDFTKPEIECKASVVDKKMIRNNIPVAEKFFKIEFSSNQILLYFEFLDKTYLQNHEIAQWNSLPYDYLLAKKWYTVYLPISDFINEQTAIDYVKKNLKSLNHLMGK